MDSYPLRSAVPHSHNMSFVITCGLGRFLPQRAQLNQPAGPFPRLSNGNRKFYIRILPMNNLEALKSSLTAA